LNINTDEYINDNLKSKVPQKLGSKSKVPDINYHVVGRYTKDDVIEDLAIQKCRVNGTGITCYDLRDSMLPERKITLKQAQNTLYYHLKHGTLFTREKHIPQQYFPTCLQSEILCKSKVKDPTGTPDFYGDVLTVGGGLQPPQVTVKAKSMAEVWNNMPLTPLGIHKIQLKTHVDPGYLLTDVYTLQYPYQHKEVIGSIHADYTIYAKGTVMAYLHCTKTPFRLATSTDIIHLFTVLSQARDRLLPLLCDTHEIIVPPLLDWNLVGCDIHKDIPITSALHIGGLGLDGTTLEDAGRYFQMYIKRLGKNAVFRVEEAVSLPDVAVAAGIDVVQSRGNNPNWYDPMKRWVGGQQQ
jgi:hypothetical protein